MTELDFTENTTSAHPFTREASENTLRAENKIWDVIIIGGGATGLGAAVDAATRGLTTLLLEQSDFAKGTSSRATKLVHGGVRYLAQGDVKLVREALYERGLLIKNAPHLVSNQPFIIPNYKWWDRIFYGIGLTLYDMLAGKLSFGLAKHISKKEIIQRLSGINPSGLAGGIVYHDGQFDDARLAINLAQTAVEQGATALNYYKVTGLIKNEAGKLAGVIATDVETGSTHNIKAKIVINATGVFVDQILQIDRPEAKPLVKPSQGIHLVFDRSFMPATDALMIPKTEDGRVLFAVPWHNKLLVGTTDTPMNNNSLEPLALEEEIDFVLRTAGRYLSTQPRRADVLSVFAGLRPLAAPQDGSSKTKEISRSHKIITSPSGLITIIGGKWTTYRRMGEDVIDEAVVVGGLICGESKTAKLPIHGSGTNIDRADALYVYGADITALKKMFEAEPQMAEMVHQDDTYTKGEVIWSVRKEMARTVEDILARRTRILFLDARLAIAMAPEVARLMAEELAFGDDWIAKQVEDFNKVAANYVLA